MAAKRSKRRSYFLSRFFARKCEFISQPYSINKCLGYQELPIPVPWVILPLTSGREERFSVKSKKFGRIWLAVEKRFDFLCFQRMFLCESSLREKWQLKLSSTILPFERALSPRTVYTDADPFQRNTRVHPRSFESQCNTCAFATRLSVIFESLWYTLRNLCRETQWQLRTYRSKKSFWTEMFSWSSKRLDINTFMPLLYCFLFKYVT